MKRILYIIVLILSISLIVGCSDKKITVYDENTGKTTTLDAASFYHMQQVEQYKAYLEARKEPAEVATITDPVSGNVISIKSQIAPPMIEVKQHQNQWAGPMFGLFNNLAKYGFYGFAAHEIADAFKDNNSFNITNSGAGSVTTSESGGDLHQSSGWTDDNSDSSDSSQYTDSSDNSTNTTTDETTTTTTTTDTVTTTTDTVGP